MIDETETWRVSGEDGRTVISGTWSSEGPVVRALCCDAETAEYIVRMHNEKRFMTRPYTGCKPLF